VNTSIHCYKDTLYKEQMNEQWTFYFSYILFKVFKKKCIKYEIKTNKSSQHEFIGKIPSTQNEVYRY